MGRATKDDKRMRGKDNNKTIIKKRKPFIDWKIVPEKEKEYHRKYMRKLQRQEREIEKQLKEEHKNARTRTNRKRRRQKME